MRGWGEKRSTDALRFLRLLRAVGRAAQFLLRGDERVKGERNTTPPPDSGLNSPRRAANGTTGRERERERGSRAKRRERRTPAVGEETERMRESETETETETEKGRRGANPPTWNASRRLRKISSVGVIIKKYVSPQTYARTTLGAGGPPFPPPRLRAEGPLFLLLTRRLFLRPHTRSRARTFARTHTSAGGHSSRTSLVRHVLRDPSCYLTS